MLFAALTRSWPINTGLGLLLRFPDLYERVWFWSVNGVPGSRLALMLFRSLDPNCLQQTGSASYLNR